MRIPCSLLFTLVLGLLGPDLPARAEESRPWSGCNMHGCWYNGGGCNMWGCWNTRIGACNMHGCSNNGACNMHGCPPGPSVPGRGYRRGGPGAPSVIVREVQTPAPPPRAAPDYARESTAQESVRVFNQAGIRFEHSDALTVSATAGSSGAYAEIKGPRSFAAYILRKKTEAAPRAVQDELAEGLVRDMVARGPRHLGASNISADFGQGVRQGRRYRLDNRSDIMLLDFFSWRRADGDVLVLYFSYDAGDADLALRFIPTIAQSIQ